MNIRYLKELLDETEEMMVIGKTAEMDGVICHVMGIVREGTTMRLLVLQYDEDFCRRLQEAEAAADQQDFLQYMDENGEDCLSCLPEVSETNRMRLLCSNSIEAANPFQGVRKISLGESEFEVNSWSSHQLSSHEWKSILLIYEFLHRGWQPDGIDLQSIESLFLVSMELDGEYSAIPLFGENPTLQFIIGPENKSFPVEQPITLIVGNHSLNKIKFQNGVTGQEHWAHINRVYLMDVWAEMEKDLAKQESHVPLNPKRLTSMKAALEKSLLKTCPKGMCYPVIEYECEEYLTLQFFTKAYLDAVPEDDGSNSVNISIHPDLPAGKSGSKLKAAMIEEPFPKDTVRIDAELLLYIQDFTSRDVVMK